MPFPPPVLRLSRADKMYQIKLTTLAKAFAFKAGGEEPLIDWARKELTEVVDRGCKTHDNGCPDLIFHTLIPRTHDEQFDWDQQQFICTQHTIENDHGIIIDTATPEETDKRIDEGQFKGFKLIVPSPDTSDD